VPFPAPGDLSSPAAPGASLAAAPGPARAAPRARPMREEAERSLSNTDPGLRPCWHPVALDREVHRRPLQVRLLGETWYVWREQPARHPPLVRAVRAGSRAPAAAVTVRDGVVFLAPEPPVTVLLDVDVACDPSYLVGWLDPIRARVGAGLMTDNFLDMAHFPFLHAATIGADELTRFDDVTVTRQGWGMTVCSEHEFANHEDQGVAAGLRPLVQRRRVTFVYRAPFSMSLRLEYLDAGGTNVIAFYIQPEDAQSCRLYCALYRDDLGRPDDPESHKRMAEAVRYEGLILGEDLSLQTRYRDLRLPLDLRTEVHIRADAPTIELRRILSALVDAGARET
jgi:phenylpropionate dioxygenase-like ring-hydroxylating dioxygenase large terminal subunit